VASGDEQYAMSLARSISGVNFRAYVSGDMIGVEVGGATKNVLAIGAGIEIARLPELFAFAILVAVTAVAVVQVLVALLGMRGWLLALVFVALQVAAQELGVDPNRIDVIVDTTRELGFGQTTGSRGTLMVAGSVSDAAAAALAGGCEVGVDYEGEYVVDWTQKLGDAVLADPRPHGRADRIEVTDHQRGAHADACEVVGPAVGGEHLVGGEDDADGRLVPLPRRAGDDHGAGHAAILHSRRARVTAAFACSQRASRPKQRRPAC